MRVTFKPKDLDNIKDIYETIAIFNIADKVFPPLLRSFDNVTINNLESYTDLSRYDLNVYELNLNRCYTNNEFAQTNNSLIKNANIQVFELTLNFKMDITFELFRKDYVDYWNNDKNFSSIKPFIMTNGSKDMTFNSFNSLATSYFANIVNLLDTNNIMCQKKQNKIVLAFALDSISRANTNLALDNFIDAIYEMVKVTSGRGNFEIPINQDRVEINIADSYAKRRIRNTFKRKGFAFIKY